MNLQGGSSRTLDKTGTSTVSVISVLTTVWSVFLNPNSDAISLNNFIGLITRA